jgi:hypothetical protein
VTPVTARFSATVETYISAARMQRIARDRFISLAVQEVGGGEKRNRQLFQPLLSLPVNAFTLRANLLI